MNPKVKQLLISLILGLVLVLGLQLVMGVSYPPDVILAQGTTRYVDSATGSDGSNDSIAIQAPFTTVVVITPTAISHEFYGAGVHIFDADHHTPNLTNTLNLTSTLNFTSSLAALKLKYLRAPFGPNWDDEKIPPPPACNDETHREDSKSMYDFIKQYFNGDGFPDRLDNAKTISNIAEKQNIEMIFLNWRAHTNWLTDTIYKELKEKYIDDYACFVAQEVKFLTDEGVTISYLEPTNEPSDTHDTKIRPQRYNTFVKLLRAYLDIEGLAEVRILGPGLAYLNHNDTCRDYVEALDDDGLDAIWSWAFHAWDPKFFPEEPEEDILRIKWKECHTVIKEREGSDHPKPIFITEYACVNDPGNGICAVENTLTLLDQGANVVVYWYLREQDWPDKPENRKRALLTENYEEKPTFTALATVLPFISGDEVRVLETQIDDQITAASFHKADHESGKKQFIVVLVNSHPVSETVLIDFTESYTVEIENGILYISDTNTITDLGFVQCQADGDRIRCPLSLQPNTIATLVSKGSFRLNLPIIIKSVDGS